MRNAPRDMHVRRKSLDPACLHGFLVAFFHAAAAGAAESAISTTVKRAAQRAAAVFGSEAERGGEAAAAMAARGVLRGAPASVAGSSAPTDMAVWQDVHMQERDVLVLPADQCFLCWGERVADGSAVAGEFVAAQAAVDVRKALPREAGGA